MEYPLHYQKRAAAIGTVRVRADELNQVSELLRATLDALDGDLRKAAEIGAIDQETYDGLFRHIERVRRARNGMECFAAECKIKEAMQSAWEKLP